MDYNLQRERYSVPAAPESPKYNSYGEGSNKNSSSKSSKYNFYGKSGNKNSSSKSLKRIEFYFKGKTFKFLLNPESYEQVETNRMSITHTKMGAYIEAFGPNIVEISISGTTGFKNNTSNPESGYKKFKELRDLIKSVYDNINDGKEITEFLEFYNFTDNEYYITYPDKFSLSRHKNQPLLYKYSIHLYCVRRIGEPEKKVEILSVVSPLKVENTVKPEANTGTMQDVGEEIGDAVGDAVGDAISDVIDTTTIGGAIGGVADAIIGTVSKIL